ncbi:MAG: guanylate kinase [Erysipelothrix sp.]|nr:guanylate kinase [Erysipelothrix sp.]
MKKGLLIIYSGPSGVGKGTVREEFINDKDLNLIYSISLTTRAPRVGEVRDKDYFFVNQEEFDEAVANNKLLEHASFVGNSYGTPRDYVEKMRNQGYNVILEIEVEGAKQIMKNTDDYLSIFLVPPSLHELERRIRSRQTESEEVIQKRMEKARNELEVVADYHYAVVNTTPKKAAQRIRKIILDNIKD